MKKMSASVYAWNVLRSHGMDASSLLELAHNQENTWLEFKADPFCNRDKGKASNGEIIWHTLKEIVAMINTRGGCIIFGIDDKTKNACPLLDADGKEVNDFDQYHRQVRDKFLCVTSVDIPAAKDAKGRKDRIVLSRGINSCCELKAGVKYKGQTVSVLLVHPLADKEYVWLTRNGKDELLVRQAGDEGRAHFCTAREVSDWVRPQLDFDREDSGKKFNNMLSPVDGFVGRKPTLGEISKALARFDVWRIPLVVGPAGIGKTEVVFKYAQIHNVHYETLALIDCAEDRSIVEAFARMATNPDFRRRFLPEVNYPERKVQSAEELFMGVRMAIADGRLGRTLIVLDDVRHSNVLRSELIRRYLGDRYDLPLLDIIATARNPKLRIVDGDMVVKIEVPALTEEEGVCILNHKRELGNEKNREFARSIVGAVWGNPWAIDLVGEYLKQKEDRSDADYEGCLALLKREFSECFPPKGKVASRMGNSTGVIGVRELVAPTIEGLEPEERDFCRLLAMGCEKYSEEQSLRGALAYL